MSSQIGRDVSAISAFYYQHSYVSQSHTFDVVAAHDGSNPVRAFRKWYDNIVAAASYIGPMNVGTQGVVHSHR
jgi:hypothetical protein